MCVCSILSSTLQGYNHHTPFESPFAIMYSLQSYIFMLNSLVPYIFVLDEKTIFSRALSSTFSHTHSYTTTLSTNHTHFGIWSWTDSKQRRSPRRHGNRTGAKQHFDRAVAGERVSIYYYYYYYYYIIYCKNIYSEHY